MKKVKIISFLVISLAILSVFSYTVKLVNLQPNNMGWYGSFIYRLSNFPEKVLEVANSNEVKGIPHTYQIIDSTYTKVNKLEDSLFMLNPFWNDRNNEWEVRLLDLKNDSVYFQWILKEEYFSPSDRKYSTSVPRAPLITKKKGLIYFQSDSKNLICIDQNSSLLWKNESFTYHHTLNFNHDSSLVFVCATKAGFIKDELKKQTAYNFKDDIIAVIDAQTGKTKNVISVIDILLKKDIHGLAFGSSSNTSSSDDPIHLNDVEEVDKDGVCMKKGDLFLSSRNKSLIIHYRPNNDSLIKIIQGPFMNQHDVDIQSDSIITVFNNNMVFQESKGAYPIDQEAAYSTSSSNIVEYNLSNKTFTTKHNEAMKLHRLRTTFQGQHEYLSSGRLVLEIQNKGIICVFNSSEELILLHTLDTDIEGYIQRPNWIRVYDEINFD